MARDRVFDEPATHVIRVRVTPSQHRDLQQVARQNHTDISGVIREAVNEYVSDCRETVVFAGNRRTTQEDRP